MSNLNDFKNIINSLRGRFFTLDEFPAIQRDVLPMNILNNAMKVSHGNVRSYSFSLKGKELEGLLLDLRDTTEEDEIRRAAEILVFRISPRILKLLTILYQFNYTSIGLNRTLEKLAENLKENGDTSREAAFTKRFGDAEDKVAAISMAIDEYELDIDKCFQAYSINSKSPLAIEVILKYLGNASKEGLMTNRRWIVGAVEQHDKDQIHRLVKNYLLTFALVEFHDGINLAILQKIGQPYVSPDWECYDVELRDKFAQWCFLHQLKLHSMCYTRKFSVLAKYYEQVRNSYQIKEESLMVIDFGDIVIADISNNSYSFFYEKSVFEKEMGDWQYSKELQQAWSADSSELDEERPEPYLPTFLRIDKKNLTARDFIIEEVEEPCVKLSYEGIDVLYIQEMLDIKMGLEPDLRRKQLAKIRRKGSASAAI